jgi:2-dehydropantoate 2-reductase
MDIVILGGGALGSILAGLLTRAGEDVTLLARGRRAEFLKARGVILKGLVEDTVRVRVETDPAALRRTELLIVTPKTYDTEAALAPLAHLDLEAALSVQNGVLKNEQLAAVFGAQKTLGCIATFSGEVLEDGAALYTQNRAFHVGELPTGVSPRVERIVTTLRRAGIAGVVNERIADGEWSKFVAWCPMMALSVLTRLPSGRFCADPQAAAFAVAMVREVAAVAAAQGVTLDDSGPLPAQAMVASSQEEAAGIVTEMGRKLAAAAPNHRMSTLQDLENGKRLEVDETLGHVVRLARRAGLPVPVTEAAWRLVAAIDRGRADP